jgi:hypothetical protein
VAATAGVAETLAVFGVRAAVSGAAQLVVALRRRAQFGRQLPMLLAGGGAEFVIEAWLLRRRMRQHIGRARPVLNAAA